MLVAKLEARGYGDRKLRREPGRSLVGNAGICVTEVLYLKPGEHKNFCIIDAAMNDLPRPAMYQAFHAIAPVSPSGKGSDTGYAVVAPAWDRGARQGRDEDPWEGKGPEVVVASASMSWACARVVPDRRSPPSMRATSANRCSPWTAATELTTVAPALCLATTR